MKSTKLRILLLTIPLILAIPIPGIAANIQSRCPQGYHLTKGHYDQNHQYVKAHCIPKQK